MLEPNHNFYAMLQGSGNVLLTKGNLGSRKPGIYSLPPDQFSYGKSTGEDKEGARDLIQTWQVHEKSQKLPNEPDFRMLNTMSVGNGLSTATEFRTYRKGKDIRIHTSGQGKRRPDVPDITFGLAVQHATPIKALMGNFYGRLAIEELHKAYRQTPALKISKWNSTRGFELLKSAKKKKSASETNLFKMRKFQVVKPRTDCWRPKLAEKEQQ
jgi:hypothetical protein